jgi:DNA invertase Pin-like site-specific DNA recombinase
LNTRFLLESLELFNSLGIDFVSLRESIDTSTATGKLVFTILGDVAELERSNIRSALSLARKQPSTAAFDSAAHRCR